MSGYISSGFFVLRAPLLSVSELLQLSSPLAGVPESSSPHFTLTAARTRLRQWLERPATQEALWIASPDLLESLTPWRDDPESAKGQKLERALYRYFARMTARSTPFGTFAACTVGEVARETRLELAEYHQCRRSTHLDMEYVFNLAEAIALDATLRRHVVFRQNDSLHLAAGKYHHLRQQWQDGARVYHLVVTDPSPALAATLQRATGGATAQTLASALAADDPDVTFAQAEEFIAVLIESQVLVATLLPPVTGAEPIAHMISQLERAQLPGLAANLRALATDLRALDAQGIGADFRSYEQIEQRAAQLPAGFRPGHLVQVDVTRPAAAATLDQRMVDEILNAVTVLHSIQVRPTRPALQTFKEEFALRYQDRGVPLLEALDDEAGVGFESEDNSSAEPLLAGINLQSAGQGLLAESAGEKSLLLRRVEQLAANREIILHLDTQLLNELAIGRPLPLPDSFAALGSCFRDSNGKQGFYLKSVSGPSGANLVARFCDTDKRLAERVQEHLRAEEALHRGDVLFAEIVHLPEGRIGNVLRRPVLRHYEIPFLAMPGVPLDRQLPLSDLTLSLRGDRMILRSERFGREVMPRLTSAHDFTAPRNLKIYKFLCLLQQQGVTPYLSWDWGALPQLDFLPRVVLGNIVLSPACWTIDGQSAQQLCRGQGDQRLRRVQEWRQVNSVPRFAAIAEGDNHLVLDLENPLSVETFLDQIGKRSHTILVEMFPAPADLPARGPEGGLVHEIVLPFVREQVAAPAPTSVSLPVGTSIGTAPRDSDLVPASDWLFAKLYCSPLHADRLLLELVKPLVEEALASGAADRWFFVRYSDPRWHLRIRFHGDPAALRSRVLSPLRQLAGDQQLQGTLWRLEFDKYEPEVDRYGGPLGIHVAENVFQLDSELCLELLELTSGDTGSELRWKLALCAVDRLLSALGLSLKEKNTLAQEMVTARRQDFVVDRTYKDQMARKFRSHRQTLTDLLQKAGAQPNFPAREDAEDDLVPAAAIDALSRLSVQLKRVRCQLEDLAGKITKSVPELASSLVHMHLNRMFRSRHHEQEAVVCELLSRAYASALAQSGVVHHE